MILPFFHVCFMFWERDLLSLAVPGDDSCLAISRDLTLMVWTAGATSSLNCSLCEAGTYGTGSGQGALKHE